MIGRGIAIVALLLGLSLGLEAQEATELSIRAAVEMALAQNEQLNQARESAVQSTAQFEQLDALKMPTLEIQGQAINQAEQAIDTAPIVGNLPGSIGFPPRFVILEPFQIQATASLGVLLTTFGKVENQVVAAFLQAKAEQENFEVSRQQVVNQTKVAYVSLLAAEEAIVAARQNLDSTRDHLDQARILLKNGMVSEFDVVKAEQEVAQAEEQLATATSQRAIAQAQFLFILNEDPPFRWRLTAPQRPSLDDAVTLADLKKLGRKFRPEMKVAETSLEAANKLVDAAYAESNPSLNLSFNYFRQSGSFLQPDDQAQILLGFQIPLFDGGVRLARVKEAESSYRSLQSSAALLEDQVDLEVESSYFEFRQARTTVAAAAKDLELAEVSHRMAQARYENGISTSLELEDALRSLISARSNLVRAKDSLGLAFLKLELALGLEIPDYQLNNAFVEERLEGGDDA